jgi:hypothetical protein
MKPTETIGGAVTGPLNGVTGTHFSVLKQRSRAGGAEAAAAERPEAEGPGWRPEVRVMTAPNRKIVAANRRSPRLMVCTNDHPIGTIWSPPVRPDWDPPAEVRPTWLPPNLQ